MSPGSGNLGTGMQLTPRAMRAIELSYDEVRQLNDHLIGTEHLLLGLIREGDGAAARVLVSLGANLDRTRRECSLMVTELRQGGSGGFLGLP